MTNDSIKRDDESILVLIPQSRPLAYQHILDRWWAWSTINRRRSFSQPRAPSSERGICVSPTSVRLKLSARPEWRSQVLRRCPQLQPVNLRSRHLKWERRRAICTRRRVIKFASGICGCSRASASCRADTKRLWCVWRRGTVPATRITSQQAPRIITLRWVIAGWSKHVHEWFNIAYRCSKLLNRAEMSFPCSTSSRPTTTAFKRSSSHAVLSASTLSCSQGRVTAESSAGTSATVSWSSQWTTRTRAGSPAWRSTPTSYCRLVAAAWSACGTSRPATPSPRWKPKPQSTTSHASIIASSPRQSKF